MIKRLGQDISRRDFCRLLSFAAIDTFTDTPILSKIGNGTHLSKHFSKVVRVHSSNATNWKYLTEKSDRNLYINYINQSVVTDMFNLAVVELTGKSSIKEAWRSLIKYSSGDKVAIKVNFSEGHLGYGGHKKSQIYPTPQVMQALIDGLTNYAGVPKEKIYLFELVFDMPKGFWERLQRQINYIDGNHILANADRNVPVDLRNPPSNGVVVYLPNVLTESQHLINVVGMRTGGYHLRVTEFFKNHYGTVRFSDNHKYPDYLHANRRTNIVDINRNIHIKNKTRLFICDFLFGAVSRYMLPHPWISFPGDTTPNSIIISKDPVALGSVMTDYLERERKARGMDTLLPDFLEDADRLFGLGTYERGKFKKDFSYERINYRVLHNSIKNIRIT